MFRRYFYAFTLRCASLSCLWGCANRIVNGRAVCDSHHINEDVLYATYHAAVKAMIEDAGALLEVIKTETEVEMQPCNKAAMDEVEQ